MSTTTQILFNSPALHSLKRDQLVKLCKIHSIKASGKNVELIERLKQHANTLPNCEPIQSDETTDGDEQDQDMDEEILLSSLAGHSIARPSEQWEVVMDDIEEETSSQGTGTLNSLRSMGSAGEFGIGGSKSSSMSSSIKALATSLGIKRSGTSKCTSSSTFPGALASSSSLSIMPRIRTKSTSSKRSKSSTPPAEDDNDELTAHARPYADLPVPRLSALPQTDHFTLSTPDTTMSTDLPLPGHASRPGVPAPPNARLSTGTGGSTTIRLVSVATNSTAFTVKGSAPGTPQLKAIATSFDLLTSPSVGKIPVWPLSPTKGAGERLYPALPTDYFPHPAWKAKRNSTETNADVQMDVEDNVGIPGGMSTPGPVAASPSKTPLRPSNEIVDLFSPAPGASLGSPRKLSEPFIFGSPLPQHSVSNKEFGTAAAAVLQEMNRRLSAVGGQKIGMDLLEKKPDVLAAGGEGRIFGIMKTEDRFKAVHEKEFEKMESIATHYAARRGMAAAEPGLVPGTKKRKSEALVQGHPGPSGRGTNRANTRVISNGVRKKMIPGGFGEEVESEEEEDRRMSKRVRVVREDGGMDNGKRMSLAPPPAPEREKREKERDAVKKMLELKREKRRSSLRSVPKPPANQKAKGVTSRFGFLTSAKTMVKNVWNMGVGSTTKTPAAQGTNIPVPKVPPTKPVPPPVESKNDPKNSARTGVIKTGTISSKRSFGFPMTHRRTGSGDSAHSHTSGTSTTIANTRKVVKAATIPAGSAASKVRSPIPTFGSRLASNKPPAMQTTTAASSKPTSSTAPSRLRARASTLVDSSLSAKGPGHVRTNSTGGSSVTSMGARRAPSVGTAGPPGASTKSTGRPSSTLYAPTASSLAKTRNSVSNLPKVSEQSLTTKGAAAKGGAFALNLITNSPRQASVSSVRTPPGKIFSRPLSAKSSPSLIPVLAKPVSLGAAASVLATGLQTNTAKPVAPPPAPTPANEPKPKPTIVRKPRISRSRVIAKLGAQRAALAAGPVMSPSNPRISASAPRKRSSGGVGARRSFGGAIRGVRAASGDAVMMSAKKRARQSEYMRRRSRATGSAVSANSGLFGESKMNVDAD